MTERQGILKRMEKIEDYFQAHSIHKVLFIPEFECARMIREKIRQEHKLTMQEAQDIVEIYNKTNAGQHYNGSGWMDYMLHLRHLLRVDSFKLDDEDSSRQIRINSR